MRDHCRMRAIAPHAGLIAGRAQAARGAGRCGSSFPHLDNRLALVPAQRLDRQPGPPQIGLALAMAIGLYNREPAPVVYDFDRPLVLSV